MAFASLLDEFLGVLFAELFIRNRHILKGLRDVRLCERRGNSIGENVCFSDLFLFKHWV